MKNKTHRHVSGPLKQKNKAHKTGSHKSKRFLKTNFIEKPKKSQPKSVNNSKSQKKQKIMEKLKENNHIWKSTGIIMAPKPIAIVSISKDFPAHEILTAYQQDSNYTVNFDWINSNCRDFFEVESKDKRDKFLFLISTQNSAFYLHDLISCCHCIWILRGDDLDYFEYESVFDTFQGLKLPLIYHIFKNGSKNKFLEQSIDFGPFTNQNTSFLDLEGVISPLKLRKCVPFSMKHFKFFIAPKNQPQTVHIIGQKLTFDQTSKELGTLHIDGYIRGGNFNPLDLAYIQGFGHFQISSIGIFDSFQNIVRLISRHDQENHNFRSIYDTIKNYQITGVNDVINPQPTMEIEENEFSDSHSNISDMSEISEEINTEPDENIYNCFESIEKCKEMDGIVENLRNLPILKLPNINNVKNAIFKEFKKIETVPAGNYVRVKIENVPRDLYEYFSKITGRLILYKLYPFEEQLTICHYLITKKSNTPITSSGRFVFFVGSRRFSSSAAFSYYHKSQQNFLKIVPTVTETCDLIVSLVSYVCLANAPVVMFAESDGELTYVGNGHSLNFPNHQTLVREIVLTGIIRKAHKSHVVITGIFKDRREVVRFMNIPVYTDSGDKGTITKPIGTHGAFKCHFTLPSYQRQIVSVRFYQPYFLRADIQSEIYIS